MKPDLIQQPEVHGAPTEAARAHDVLRRQFAAVLAADVVGYTRLMELDETATHWRLMNLRMTTLDPAVLAHGGRIVKNTGDGFLAMFDTAEAACRCAIDMHRQVTTREGGIAPDRRIAFRMGVNLADVIVEDDDIYGDGVNIAARLQTYAEPGGVAISDSVAREIAGKFDASLSDIGLFPMRNMAKPIRVYSIGPPERAAVQVGEVPHGYEVRPSIAVLPFHEDVADPSQAYFAGGFVDNVIHTLSGLRDIFVIARASTAGFAGDQANIVSAGRALGVRYVLRGRVQRSAGRLRVWTELGEAETGHLVRSDRYDGDIADLFSLQDRISEDVVKTLAPQVRARELERALRKHPQNMNAYDFVLQALGPLFSLDELAFSKARALLQRAISCDPSYSPSYSYAAYWHCYRIGQEWSRNIPEDWAEALRLARAAIELDSNDALAWTVHGHVQSFAEKDFDLAIRSFGRATTACPNLAIAWLFNAVTLCFVGAGADALARAESGFRLSPQDANIFFAEHVLAQAHYVCGNFNEAVLWARRAEKHNPRLCANLRTLAASLAAIENLDAARDVARRHDELVPHFSVAAWAARTPMQGRVREERVERLRRAGFSD